MFVESHLPGILNSVGVTHVCFNCLSIISGENRFTPTEFNFPCWWSGYKHAAANGVGTRLVTERNRSSDIDRRAHGRLDTIRQILDTAILAGVSGASLDDRLCFFRRDSLSAVGARMGDGGASL